jgi:hypothetical protein
MGGSFFEASLRRSHRSSGSVLVEKRGGESIVELSKDDRMRRALLETEIAESALILVLLDDERAISFGIEDVDGADLDAFPTG